MKALYNGEVIADSNDTVFVEGNHYFPKESVNQDVLKSSDTQSICPWKGTASYFTIALGGQENVDAAWYYKEPKEAAKEIKDHIAFWKGVEIID